MKQVYKGEILTTTKTVNQIIKTYLLASDADKFDWYLDAHNYAIYLSKQFNCSVVQACGVIAALSPVKRWEQNKTAAYDLLKTGTAGHMKQFVNKSKLIVEFGNTEEDVLKILNGEKIKSFFLNILHPTSGVNVTIDRHALSIATNRICTDDYYSGMTVIQYNFFVNAYKKAAEKLGVSPLLVQSATWVYFRKNKSDWK